MRLLVFVLCCLGCATTPRRNVVDQEGRTLDEYAADCASSEQLAEGWVRLENCPKGRWHQDSVWCQVGSAGNLYDCQPSAPKPAQH